MKAAQARELASSSGYLQHSSNLAKPRARGTVNKQSGQARKPSPKEQPLKYLVVDDDSLVLFSVAAMLENLGHQVVEKDNAADAYALLEHNDTIDLVITDHAMPQMTGAELAEAVHQE
ncbi:response regulator [Modicisalibacter luteus]|uniref:Response regulator n=1 Tax=Modicisalibacter luteus TaxID=453962 RepID=A0ABV7M2T5_9GAMM|nr:hypothetical protein GCM10007159_41090 [Halomonas lutea]